MIHTQRSSHDLLYLFDMDGTLTPSRLPMLDDFANWFRTFIKNNIVYIVSGSDIDKIKSQIPLDIFNEVEGIYSSMGNEFYIKGKPIYQKDFTPSAKLETMLETFRKETKYPNQLFPNYIERRIGMINFSVLGRDCPFDERLKYKAWDDTSKERFSIQQKLQELFPDLEISLGGNISLDITLKNYGKEQVADHLRTSFPNSKIIFSGDKTNEGGNDYSLAQRLLSLENTKIIPVNSPDDLLIKLKI